MPLRACEALLRQRLECALAFSSPASGSGGEGEQLTPQQWVDLVYIVFSVGAAVFMLWFARRITRPRR